MQYHDFEIRIHQDARGDFVAEVLRAPYARRATAAFHPPFDADVVSTVIEGLEWWVRCSNSKRQEARDLTCAQENRRTLAASPTKVGEELFQALFSGQVGELFQQSLAHVRGRGDKEGLRLRLSFDLNEDEFCYLSALPWELLFQKETMDFLGRQRDTAVVRDLPLRRSLRSPRMGGSIRTLVVDASPSNLPGLNLVEEKRSIKRSLEQFSAFEVVFLNRPGLKSLREALLHIRPDVLHFMGHGSFDSASGDGILYFEDQMGRSVPVSGAMMGDILKGVDSLQVVVLNACDAGALVRRRGQSPYVAVTPAILLAGVPAVIAMQFPISDRAAIIFSEEFYSRLADGDPVDAAVIEGRLAIHIDDPQSLEWVTPVLFLNTDQREILPRQEAQSAAPVASTLVGEYVPLRIGIRSFHRWGRGMEKRVERLLDLAGCFRGAANRNINDRSLWEEEILPEVARFLETAAEEHRPIVIELAAHASIAFAAGYYLEVKSGTDVTILQRTLRGTVEWRALQGHLPEGALWLEESERTRDADANDVALAVEIAESVLDDVELFLQRSGIAVTRILNASIAPYPSATAVSSGLHALRLAESLSYRIKNRTSKEREGILHLFSAAPNGFMFFFGQLAKKFGRIQLYEYDPDLGRPGAYTPSIRLPHVGE